MRSMLFYCIRIARWIIARQVEVWTRSLADRMPGALAFDTQAIGRVRRFPQEHIVCVHRFYVRGSVEEELLVAQGLQGL